MKTVYLSGPMRGHVGLNRAAFDKAHRALAWFGYRVINPHDLDVAKPVDWDTKKGYRKGVLRDLKEVAKADYIALLHGWQLSVGASAEASVAEWLKKPFLLQQPDGSWVGPKQQWLFTTFVGEEGR